MASCMPFNHKICLPQLTVFHHADSRPIELLDNAHEWRWARPRPRGTCQCATEYRRYQSLGSTPGHWYGLLNSVRQCDESHFPGSRKQMQSSRNLLPLRFARLTLTACGRGSHSLGELQRHRSSRHCGATIVGTIRGWFLQRHTGPSGTQYSIGY